MQKVRRLIVSVLTLFLGILSVEAQMYTISGFVNDSISGESLLYASIYDATGKKGTVTNEKGFFSLSLPAGITELRVSYVGYRTRSIHFTVTGNSMIRVLMQPQLLEEVVITGNESPVPQTVGGAHHLSVKKLERLPVLMGEPDIIKSLQLIPGIQAGSEGSVGVSIRGGSPDQNLILLDGMPVYNIGHAYGFFSIFNSDALNDVTVYKGSFPARYGDRLSSVIDIRTKEGNNRQLAGAASIGLIASRFTLEGPLAGDKTTFVVSARRSYIDLIAKRLFSNLFDYDDGKYYFYDLNTRLTHRFSEKSKLSAGFYSGRDKETYSVNSSWGGASSEYSDQRWGNLQGNLTWNYVFGAKLYGDFSFGYSRYRMTSHDNIVNASGNSYMQYITNYCSSITDISQRADFQVPVARIHNIRFGEAYTVSWFAPKSDNERIAKDGVESKNDTVSGRRNVRTHQLTFYAEDEVRLGRHWQLNAGLRYSSYFTRGIGYHTLDPRIAVLWQPSPTVKVKAGYTPARQFIHLLSTAKLNMATDMWIPSTSAIAPQYGQQASAGIEWQPTDMFIFGIDGYYKYMSRLVDYKDGASYIMSQTGWEDEIEQGKSKMYGAEFSAEKKTGEVTGWIAYTLSKSERQFTGINGGNTYPYRYGRRHDLKIVFQYKFSEKWDIGAAWFFNTGNYLTVATQQYSYILYYQRNAYQTSNCHRLDLSINYRRRKKHHVTVWSLEVYNAYNRKNVYSAQTVSVYTPDRMYEIREKYLFPCLPSLTFRIEFGH